MQSGGRQAVGEGVGFSRRQLHRANEALSKKDFQLRIKICRKEAKESSYWLRLVDTGEDRSLDADRNT
jgi:hypothetical protein